MTYAIPVSSLKQPRAERFARELERAMQERGVGSRVLAEAVSCGRTSVQQWRGARILPRIAMAQRLSEALDWPRLVAIAVEVRRKECVVCHAAFVDDSGSDNRVYCSAECRRVKGAMDLGTDRRKRSNYAEHRLREHMAAVSEMCRQCQPEGVCVDGTCPLRSVSPLPLRDEGYKAVDQAVARPRNGYRAPGADSARMSRIWASYTPEQREARKARAAEASRRARGLVAP